MKTLRLCDYMTSCSESYHQCVYCSPWGCKYNIFQNVFYRVHELSTKQRGLILDVNIWYLILSLFFPESTLNFCIFFFITTVLLNFWLLNYTLNISDDWYFLCYISMSLFGFLCSQNYSLGNKVVFNIYS